jgi:heat shock protein HspQ
MKTPPKRTALKVPRPRAMTETPEPSSEGAPAKVKSTKKKRPMGVMRTAKFSVGDVVKHRLYPFRGIVFDIDPVFANTEEWWLSIPPERRPRKDQPFYHLLAENAETEYIAYVSEQNLLPDDSGRPVRHPQVKELFKRAADGTYAPIFLAHPH